MSYGTFILPKGIPINHVKETLKEINEFAKKMVSDWDDNIGGIFIIDEKFIRKNADDFGEELRSWGTIGLIKRYNGQYCFTVFDKCPTWVLMALQEILQARYLPHKNKREDW